MSIKKLVSLSTLWKGLEYYNENRVYDFKNNGDGTYDALVRGVEIYQVHLDTNDLKKSTCTCPHGLGKKKVLCKHIVATYFEAFPEEAKKANIDLYAYHDDESEDEYEKEYKRIREIYKNYVDGLSEEEVREFLLSQLVNDYFDAKDRW